MKIAKTIGKVALVFFLIGLLFSEIIFQFARTTPPHDRVALMADPVFQAVVRPNVAPEFAHAYAERIAGRSIPRWVFDRFLPYEAGILISGDSADAALQVRPYVSLPHSSEFLFNRIKGIDLSSTVSAIDWEPLTLQHRTKGLIQGEGSISGEPEALDAVFFQWGEGRTLRPMTISGNHFAEFIFDNRNGQAYLAMASMMAAFDYQLDPSQTKISLSSFQFVIDAVGRLGISGKETLEIEIDIAIEPVARNRIGVINMKGGIDEAFKEWGTRLNRDYGISITGGSEWNENTMEFRYQIDHGLKLLDALRADLQ